MKIITYWNLSKRHNWRLAFVNWRLTFVMMIVFTIIFYHAPEFLFPFEGIGGELVKAVVFALCSFVCLSFIYGVCQAVADDVLIKIDKQFQKTRAYKQHFFDVLFQQFNENPNYKYNRGKGIFFNKLICWYGNKGYEQKFYVPIDAYYDIIGDLIAKYNYKMISLSAAMIPSWYIPLGNNDTILSKYIDTLKANKDKCQRITYCTDDDWERDTVRKIFIDLSNEQEGSDIAWLWLITVLHEARNFDNSVVMEKVCSLFDDNFPTLTINNVLSLSRSDKERVKVVLAQLTDKETKIKSFFNKKLAEINASSSEITVSKYLRNVFDRQFHSDFGSENYYINTQKDGFDANLIDLDKVVEVGCFYQGDYDLEFVFLISGFEREVQGVCVEIQIIEGDTDKAREILKHLQGKINRIKGSLSQTTKGTNNDN